MEKLVQAAQGNASALTASTTPVISTNTSSTNASVSTTPTSTVSLATPSQDPQSDKIAAQSVILLTSPVGDEPEGVNQETVGSSSGGSGENEEHLQLSLEEAFFLIFAVECIAVSEKKASSTCDQLVGGGSVGLMPFSIQECWLRFAQASVFAGKSSMALPMPMPEISPDNPFIVRYAAYHHYRSLGWVVKDGLKYGTDFLLYKKGVMFGHSQFGIRVIACKSTDEVTSNTTQQHWSTGMGPLEFPLLPLSSTTPGLFVPHAVHSWQWLLALNRVISQVQKVQGAT
ncbi:tRNA splicing endonuclease subunit sen2 [Mortierella hygrophila]|uniref:tRNA-splicing endonuclease subunit Sen2 n=1 Tax=Mortierella hygrophila TaxID=979708 RepID=A0A9P6K0M5_9FUNG|nr:tRNA splicing endonuclease subunit sen2 [Mortierella hygrophila]